jgi:hypothetical protein
MEQESEEVSVKGTSFLRWFYDTSKRSRELGCGRFMRIGAWIRRVMAPKVAGYPKKRKGKSGA